MPTKRSCHALNQSPFYKLNNRSRLARIIGVKPGELRQLEKAGCVYKEFDIPKPDGGSRHVESPARPLKRVQLRIARLLSRITPPDYLFCPVRGRCYVTNAAQHIESRVVRCIDVRKYFPSTTARRVNWFFRAVMHCTPDIAGLLTALATFNGHLPTGSLLSPILSFYAHFDMWSAISAFCKDRGLKLTVYVDDITVSGAKVMQRDMWQIKKLIHSAGLRYHKQKAYIDRPAEITGVIVADGRIMPPNRQLKKRFLVKRVLQKHGELTPELVNRAQGLDGQLAQINTVAMTLAARQPKTAGAATG